MQGDKASRAPRLLAPADLPDNFTRSLYRIAPYRGCAHGCRYCDGRAERYYVEGDFERDLVVRGDVPDRLKAELPTLRERGMVSFGSGVTDPYQCLEAERSLVGRCAQALALAGRALPAMVMTKSALVLRDLETWKAVNERAGFLLLVSIATVDEALRETMEPGASPIAARLEALRAFKRAGCATGVLAMPFLPGLSDGEDSIRRLYSACAEARVDFVMPGGLTLRPGRQKDYYLAALRAFRPDLVAGTEAIYRNERPSGAPAAEVSRALAARVGAVRREFRIPWLLPHAIFARLLPPHDALRILYRDMIELYADRGIDTRALSASADAYDAWLVGLRRHFRRRRGLPSDWLEERFDEAAHSGELGGLLGNPKLSAFTSSVTLAGARLDYCSLKLG